MKLFHVIVSSFLLGSLFISQTPSPAAAQMMMEFSVAGCRHARPLVGFARTTEQVSTPTIHKFKEFVRRLTSSLYRPTNVTRCPSPDSVQLSA